jgi:hypothetical protein
MFETLNKRKLMLRKAKRKKKEGIYHGVELNRSKDIVGISYRYCGYRMYQVKNCKAIPRKFQENSVTFYFSTHPFGYQ